MSGAGIFLNVPHTRAMLADVHVLMGQPDPALAVLDDALGMCARTGEVWVEAEPHRRKGELPRADPSCAPPSASPASGASTDAARMRTALLAPIHAWFTEGFDTPDRVEAKALLDKLAAGRGGGSMCVSRLTRPH